MYLLFEQPAPGGYCHPLFEQLVPGPKLEGQLYSSQLIQYCRHSYYPLVSENCPIWEKIGQFVSANEVKLLTF